MINIAVMGYGTIGSGVVSAAQTNKSIIDKKAGDEICLKYVLDLRDFADIKERLTHDFSDILEDDSIKIVIETMGGINPAYDYVHSLLQRGKSVVTSNKELVAARGHILLKAAHENGANFLFGASVGGGIPIIRPLKICLTADRITEISGILNGTTNHILTEMLQNNKGFDEALKNAQAAGFAERDPSDDIKGVDSCRKLAILLSVITGKRADPDDIYTEGIEKITCEDINNASLYNSIIKLMAAAKITDRGVYASVSPVAISKGHPFFMVNGVYNAVLVNGNITGDCMFYGHGAGKLPTSGAIIADVIECANNFGRDISCHWTEEKLPILGRCEL